MLELNTLQARTKLIERITRLNFISERDSERRGVKLAHITASRDLISTRPPLNAADQEWTRRCLGHSENTAVALQAAEAHQRRLRNADGAWWRQLVEDNDAAIGIGALLDRTPTD